MKLKASHVFFILGVIVFILIMLSSAYDASGYFGKGPDVKTPFYEESYLIFPPNTTEWKIISDRHTLNGDIFYCLIEERWHKCHPVEGKGK